MNRLCLVVAAVLAASLASAQPAEVVPNENLVVEGIPKIPGSIADAVSRYTEFRSASFLAWHPVRREMLIGTRFADVAQVHRVRSPLGARTQLTFFPDRVGDAVYPPRDLGHFVFTKDVGGSEFFQIYRFDVDTGAVTLLTDGKSQNGGIVFSRDGGRIAYGSTRRNGKDRDIYVMNPTDPATDRRLLEVEGGGWSAVDWSPDGSTLLVSQEISANESYLWLADVRSGEKRLLTPKGVTPVAYKGGEFTPDGAAIVVSTDRGSEFQRLALIDLTRGVHTYLMSHIDWDVDAFDLSPDGATIAFVTNEDGIAVLRLLDTATRKEKPAPKLPLGVIDRVEWHPARPEVAFSLSTARSPLDVYTLDTERGGVERWTESEAGGLNPETFVEPELVHWKSFDGKSISGFLYKPPAKFVGKRPAIIAIHGGRESQAQPGFLNRYNYYLNELGVALVFPNVRGSAGYGKTFLKLDNGFLREDSVKDVGALLDWIGARNDLDPDRIMVTGGSYGGYMTLATAFHYNDRIRCALDVVGLSNFVTFLERTEAYRRDLRRVEYGDERDPKMREFMLRIAPVNNAHKITKPLFIVAGKNDPRVPAFEGEQMAATVRKNGTPVWWLMAKDEGHGFAKKKNQDFQFYATVAFIQAHLLN